jgi:hypothetical protein
VNETRIVFLSLFLGLVSSFQPVSLDVDFAVKTVRITLAGREVASLTKPPWSAVIDFGPEIEPIELAAIGYDDHGNEIARTSQIVNLPRPVAEVEIVVRREKERPVAVELHWRHRTFARPKKAIIKVDGKSLAVGRDFSAHLPVVDWMHPHVIAAEMDFDDGTVTRRELVIGGATGYSDSVGSELTPVLMTQTSGPQPASMEGCFSANGQLLRAGAMETTNALVILVKDPDANNGPAILGPRVLKRNLWDSGTVWDSPAIRKESQLDRDTTERIFWPVAKRYGEAGQPTTILFEPSGDVDAVSGGMLWLLTRTYPQQAAPEPRMFADAVATAGVAAIAQGRRRAVVLLLSDIADKSLYSPATVRRYLARIGVPLLVWSVTSPRPDLADSWGPIDDISTVERLRAATDRLRRTLAAQRVVWVAADPVTALHIEVKESCSLVPVARTRDR